MVVVGAVIPACGNDAGDHNSGGPSAGSSVPSEGSADAAIESQLLADDLALLDLVPDARQVGRGRFRLTAPEDVEGTHLAANVDGVFWTDAGRIRTSVSLDRALVDRSVNEVLGRLAGGGIDPVARTAFALTEDHYRGSRYQFGLGHLVASSGLLGTGGVVGAPGEPVPCAASRAAAAIALIAQVAGLSPDFGPDGPTQRWIVPLDDLLRRTESARAAARSACGIADDVPSPRPGLRLERTPDTLDVLLDTGLYTAPEWRHALRFEVRTDDRARVPEAGVDLADGFEPVSRFVMKIHECGSLPVEYSNFAAGDSYLEPDEGDYLGPGFLVTDYVCGPPE